MSRFIFLVLLSGLLATPAEARDTIVSVPLADLLSSPDGKRELDGSVSFYLAGQNTPQVLEQKGSDVANRKTNAFNKSDEVACKWVVLSALIALQEGAKQAGANAVVNIVSYYKRNEVKNDTAIECHAGGIVAGAALKGDYAKVAK